MGMMPKIRPEGDIVLLNTDTTNQGLATLNHLRVARNGNILRAVVIKDITLYCEMTEQLCTRVPRAEVARWV